MPYGWKCNGGSMAEIMASFGHMRSDFSGPGLACVEVRTPWSPFTLPLLYWQTTIAAYRVPICGASRNANVILLYLYTCEVHVQRQDLLRCWIVPVGYDREASAPVGSWSRSQTDFRCDRCRTDSPDSESATKNSSHLYVHGSVHLVQGPESRVFQ